LRTCVQTSSVSILEQVLGLEQRVSVI
jgi:hypothetical protein